MRGLKLKDLAAAGETKGIFPSDLYNKTKVVCIILEDGSPTFTFSWNFTVYAI